MPADPPTNQSPTLDALIVGAGFSGIYHLHQLRKRGFSVRIFEAGSDLGGAWHWNCYPGARTDSDFYIYQFAMEDLYKGFTGWTENFPPREEVLAYLHYVVNTLDLLQDMRFNTPVVSAQFDVSTDRWAVKTSTGLTVHARFLILSTGYASIPHIPPIKGLDTFQGICHHTARFPQDGTCDTLFTNKRVGVIGTGASGVQIVQSAGPVAAHLTVFQRTPQFALPMRQQPVSIFTQQEMMSGPDPLYPIILQRRFQTLTGTYYENTPKLLKDVSREERVLFFEDLWARGGFHTYLGTYMDVRTDAKASQMVYAFWRSKTLKRISDPRMQEKLMPETPCVPIGVHRFPSLEQTYYDVFNQPNVHLVDMNETPIMEVTPGGVRTADGVEHALDVLVLATGFGKGYSGIAAIDIRVGPEGVPMATKWAAGDGVKTYLGLTSAGYPNLFFSCGPGGPTEVCNGPTCIEIQGAWIVSCIEHMRKNKYNRIEATLEAEAEWSNVVQEKISHTLWGQAPKTAPDDAAPARDTIFVGGVMGYDKICRECAENGYRGFVFSGDSEVM
ncbi:Baeyer-Villiger monooxygenase [Hypsizygus marmoreus]|uniref:Baeyer-Villiger monooxygenase n=1 Tax=Hypsizygus marmoreus TaxID=39966 RepID=A0A369JVR6_HYPMA|nr:Baeyer-Villiger monooxygenase [Hypsizygus marmoreus]